MMQRYTNIISTGYSLKIYLKESKIISKAANQYFINLLEINKPCLRDGPLRGRKYPDLFLLAGMKHTHIG